MPLTSFTPMLRAARDGGYAIGAFNILDYNSALAIVRAAEKLKAPVIVQVSVKTVKLWGFEPVVDWMRRIAGNSPVPVSLHLDHCKEPDFIEQCIKAGWTDVMIDASSKPFEENLATTQKVTAMANAAGVGVEAELGEIGGVEDDIIVADADAHLADPDKAVRFCEQAGPLGVFAPAIGTAHGFYKGEPKIAFDRLEQIANRTGLPMALHGGTGLADEVFAKAIRLGCAKVNISTQLKHAFIDGFVEYHQQTGSYEPVKILAAQYERMEQEIAQRIEQFGGAGKASDALRE